MRVCCNRLLERLCRRFIISPLSRSVALVVPGLLLTAHEVNWDTVLVVVTVSYGFCIIHTLSLLLYDVLCTICVLDGISHESVPSITRLTHFFIVRCWNGRTLQQWF